MAKLGDVVILKTTGEQVVLLSKDAEGKFTGKRPCMTEDGIVHHLETIYELEFHTEEEHLRHQLEQMKLKRKLQEELKEDEPEGPDFAALRVN